MANFPFKAPLPYLSSSVMKPIACTIIPSALFSLSLLISLYLLFSPSLGHSSAFFLPQLLCFMATIKGTLTLKHDRATPTTTIIWKIRGGGGGITPVLLYIQCNLGVTFVFYHIFLGSQNSVAVSPRADRQLQPTRSPKNYKVALTPCILCNHGLWRLWLWALCLINSLRKAKFESEANT